jgi:hypothetical protein
MALLNRGLYGWTLFLLLPLLLGALGACLARPATRIAALRAGALAAAAPLALLLLMGTEGFVCIGMCLPFVVPAGALGGWMVYEASNSHARPHAAAIILLLPAGSLTWDINARPPVFAVQTAIEIQAPPEIVWRHVVSFSDLPEPHEWFFRAGLAYPKRARIVGSGPGAVRYCEFSTGPFVEPIEVWDEPRLLQFRVTENPAPMHEWSPYGEITPRHLHGYLVSKKGQFRLTRLDGNRTLLEGTTWYQHGLWPAHYWRWWSDAIIHRIHQRVLEHIRLLSES